MAYTHGVYISEVETAVVSPSEGYSGLPVVIGTSPKGPVNEPQLITRYEDAVKIFGYSDDWEHYTLCEFMYSQFALFAQGPAVMVNVHDVRRDYKYLAEKEYPVTDRRIIIPAELMPVNSESINPVSGEHTMVLPHIEGTYNVDYWWRYEDGNPAGDLVITFPVGSRHYDSTAVTIKLPVRDFTNTKSEIIGGYSSATGKYSGLELVNEVYHKFLVVPGIILAPGYSHYPEVAAVMKAKAESVSEVFRCIAIADAPGNVFSEIPAWKSEKNYTDSRLIVCWPKVKLGDKTFHLSTQLCGVMNRTDNNRGDVPYKSPSNELLQCDSCVNDSGGEVMLTIGDANYLNGQGIVTAINWTGGWRVWGNNTCAYPAVTDPKDRFIAVRRMFDYVGNTFINTFWQKADGPMTVRLVREVVNSFNLYLNGLAARDMILGGRIEFRESENVLTDLMNGVLRFHVMLTPPVPAETIEGILEYDPEYLSALYEAVRG